LQPQEQPTSSTIPVIKSELSGPEQKPDSQNSGSSIHSTSTDDANDSQKCSTCHRAQPYANFIGRGGKLGKTCQTCLGKKKRKAEHQHMQEKSRISMVEEELAEMRSVVQDLLTQNRHLVESNNQLSHGAEATMNDVISVIGQELSDVLNTAHGLDQEVVAAERLVAQNDTPMQKCSTCHRKQPQDHFSGKKTCPSCLGKKKLRHTLPSHVLHTKEKLQAIKTQVLEQNARLAKTNTVLLQDRRIALDELMETYSCYSVGGQGDIGLSRTTSSTPLPANTHSTPGGALSTSGFGIGAGTGLDPCGVVTVNRARCVTGLVGFMIVLACIVRFFVQSGNFDNALKVNRDDHTMLQVIVMFVILTGWFIFALLLYLAWASLPKQRIFFFNHSRNTMVGLLLLDVVLFVVLSMPWLLDEETFGYCTLWQNITKFDSVHPNFTHHVGVKDSDSKTAPPVCNVTIGNLVYDSSGRVILNLTQDITTPGAINQNRTNGTMNLNRTNGTMNKGKGKKGGQPNGGQATTKYTILGGKGHGHVGKGHGGNATTNNTTNDTILGGKGSPKPKPMPKPKPNNTTNSTKLKGKKTPPKEIPKKPHCMSWAYYTGLSKTYAWISSVSTILTAAIWSIILQYVSNMDLEWKGEEKKLEGMYI